MSKSPHVIGLLLSGCLCACLGLRGADNEIARAEGVPDHADARYTKRGWTREDGIPDNAVECLLQARDGWLWVGTRSGLARFDGVRFTVFNAQTPGFTDDAILCLAEDMAGNLWIGTKHGLYRKHGGTFTKFTRAEGLVRDHVSALHLALDGSLWVATHGGLNRFKNGALTGYPLTETITYDDGHSEALHQTVTVTDDRSGNLWVGTVWGIERFDVAAGTYLPAWRSPSPPAGAFGSPAQVVLVDRAGGLWTGNDDLLARREGTSWRQLPFEADAGDLRLRYLAEAVDGAVWAARAGKLFRVEGEKLIREDQRLGLSDSFVTCLLCDKEELMWVGTRYQGLQCLRSAALRVYTTADGLCHNVVVSVSPHRNGGLWVATVRGLMLLRGERFTFPEADIPMRDAACRSVFEESNGDLWVGRSPLFADEVLYLRPTPQGYRSMITGDTIAQPSVLSGDRRGRVWIGGGDGLCCVLPGQASEAGRGNTDPTAASDRQNRAHWVLAPSQVLLGDGFTPPIELGADGWRNLGRPPPQWKSFSGATGQLLSEAPIALDQQLTSYRITAVLEDRQGVVWLGTADGGLNRIRDRHVEVFTVQDGLASNDIQALCEDGEGTLWVGTSRGLSRSTSVGVPTNRPRFASFPAHAGLPAGGVRQILEGNPGVLWIGCAEGIYRLTASELAAVANGRADSAECMLLGDADGLLAGETHSGSQPSACKTPDGRLWFATPQGLAMIDPNGISRRATPPQVLLERLRAGDRRIEFLDELVWALNAEEDTLASLLGHQRTHATEYLGLAGLAVECRWPQIIPDVVVTAKIRHHLFLVVNETLRNAVQHSHATRVLLCAICGDSDLVLTIEDDGCGFDLEAARQAGNGLANMRQRVASLGGSFQISSRPGEGAKTTVEIPLSADPAPE